MIQLLKNYLWHLPNAILANIWYGFPARKLIVIGVTGTKGKTTVVHMIEHILRSKGYRVARISTIGARIGDEEIDTGLHVTSPDSVELQRLLRLAVSRGVTHVVLEVTSNGLDQFRVYGVPFTLSVITNITLDHLDYHGTFERYLHAKIMLARQSRAVVLHRQSLGFSALMEQVKKIPQVVQYRVVEGPTTSPFEIDRDLAIETAALLTIPDKAAIAALKTFPGVPGRMETIYDQEFRIIIDFAHTPESMEAILKETRAMVGGNGRLIAVFGCAGERDPGRRKMGAVAARLADFFIITAEDPRSERVEDISEEIAEYAKQEGAIEMKVSDTFKKYQILHRFTRIPDRQEAITAAIGMAKKGDVVVCLGKGHEKSMAYGRIECPWSEHEAVNIALQKTQKTQNS